MWRPPFARSPCSSGRSCHTDPVFHYSQTSFCSKRLLKSSRSHTSTTSLARKVNCSNISPASNISTKMALWRPCQQNFGCGQSIWTSSDTGSRNQLPSGTSLYESAENDLCASYDLMGLVRLCWRKDLVVIPCPVMIVDCCTYQESKKSLTQQLLLQEVTIRAMSYFVAHDFS